MGMGSFILGIVVGIIIAFILLLAYIVATFGWDFLPILMNFMDENISYQDIMNLGQYYVHV
ncbi:hypothetical protein ALNOE001_12340 [Candidatus Methanobinarius endosymbioticus]|uniref:Uncharacterized protein n=1 Tax=Candidatus Methanobinarius endosymbioticus TaxID=2006182 RepID=A0A366MBL5_9EURY|nr:hypothetical protein ALNOE001_12340 [Candidatus Methanobinarius endosymbioticus]